MKSDAAKRAEMPVGTNKILNQRSIYNSNKRLAELIRPGMFVLDAGCGNGTITKGIAELVGPSGKVLGIDSNQKLIAEARERCQDISNLSFEVSDLYTFECEVKYDIVNASRVLQWLSEPERALKQMKRAVKPGGKVLVLDYNHEKIEWQPSPPATMGYFYQRFLDWRSDAGMKNDIADRLQDMFARIGLKDIIVLDQSEAVKREMDGFQDSIGIWAEVAASRGHQLVADGYLREEERLQAELDYRAWIEAEAQSQKMYLLSVEGVRGDETDD